MLEDVTLFLEREDNSTVIVGKRKRDIVEINKEEHQKRILNDYMHNLHQKFLLENPEKKISQSSFYSMRSKYLLCASFASRSTCLCSRHQNVALKIKALRSVGMQCSKNPDIFIREQETNEKLKESLDNVVPDQMTYTHWKKKLDGTKKKMERGRGKSFKG